MEFHLQNTLKDMNKIEEIFKSWKIQYNPSIEQSELAAERIEICNKCPHKIGTDIFRCNLCGCLLASKIYSPVIGACPENRWEEPEKTFLKKSE
jgi:ribosomal protein L37AE/L43A